MSKNDLFDYMRNATHLMQSEYERIQKRAVEDPGTAGDNGEENWAALLRQWLPRSYHVVTKGRIMNTEGECGPQVDVLVLSPAYPVALLQKKEYLAGGVIAAFECKLTLKGEHVRTAVKNACEIRRLSRSRRGSTLYLELYSRIGYGLLAHSHVWQGPESSPLENIQTQLFKTEDTEAQHPDEVLDMICVSDLASWNTMKVVFARELLGKMSDRYESLGVLWDDIKNAGGAIETMHGCFAHEYQQTDEEKQLFTPIGSFICSFLQQLAWQDLSMRSLADFFSLAQLLGSGRALSKIWSLSVLSDQLAEKIKREPCLVSGERWNEWSHIL